jgi:predicted RNA-binding protein with PUA-like domain
MNHWLLAADPKSYGFGELERDRTAVWDGVKGSMAQRHLRGAASGDAALVYHTAPDKAVIGTARIVSAPYPDPGDPEGKLVVVKVEPARRFARPIALGELKANPRLAGMLFLKIQRIAVSPLTKGEFDEIVRMAS